MNGSKVPCKHFRQGYCKNGEKCPFLHPHTDSSVPAPAVADTVRKAPCIHFRQGYCKNGEKCPFLHPRTDSAVPAPAVADTVRKAPCIHFRQGYCKNGEKCPFLHPRTDSAVPTPSVADQEICRHFSNGFCKNESSCKFLHVARENGAAAQPISGRLAVHNQTDAGSTHGQATNRTLADQTKQICQQCGTEFLFTAVGRKRGEDALDRTERPNGQAITMLCSSCCIIQKDRKRQFCPLKALCTLSNCRLVHPPRAPACQNGSDCREILCNLLHPGTDLELSLMGRQPADLQKVVAILLTCRNKHKGKIAAAKTQCTKNLGVDTGGKLLVESNDPRFVALRELQQQLQCFDEALLQVWSKLKGVARPEDKEVADEGGLPQLARQNSSEYEVSEKEAYYRTKREIYRLQAALPALAKRSELVQAVRNHRSVIVRGATGSGKSTQVPAYLAEMVKLRQLQGRKIICTQPRKVAAISLASRVSEEWNCGKKDLVGQDVGYRAGGLQKIGKYTAIEYQTEGSLLNLLLGGKRKQKTELEANGGGAEKRGYQPLQNVACVILDEAHERTMTLDVILGVLSAGQRDGRWPDLKIVVTSATLDVQLFSQYLDGAPIIEIPGRMFPVDVLYKPLPAVDSDYVKAAVNLAAEIHMGPPNSGDVLVFLTGEGEVVQAVDGLERILKAAKANSPFLALPLFGKQTPEEQTLVFAKPPAGTRKIIFATDIAETSVTIDGVVHVIDTGMTKEAIYDAKRNVTVLEVGMISKSSAAQRAGRAGRTAPGTCYRLYSQDTEASMRTSQLAEVLSRPLEQTFVTVLALGLDPLRFNWIEKPNIDALRQAGRELEFLGAVDPAGVLTSLGLLIADLQVDPSLARLVYLGCQRGMGEAAATLGGLLSTASNIFFRGRDAKTQQVSRSKHAELRDRVHGDAVTLYRLYETYEAVLYATEQPADAKCDGEDSVAGEDIAELDEGLLDRLRTLQAEGVARSNANAIRDNNYDGDGLSFNDDASSVASDISDASSLDSVGSQDSQKSAKSIGDDSFAEARAEEEAERAVARRIADNRAAKRWCMENYINGKALGIATSTARDLKSASRRLNLLVGDQSKRPTNEELRRLFVGAYFLNVAVRVGEAGPARFAQYHLLRSDRASRGFFHPSSSLSDAAESPEWVVFAAVTETTRTFLTSVAPAQRAWLQEESPAFAQEVARRQGTRAVSFAVDASRAVIRKLVGRNYLQGLRVLADRVGAADLLADEDAGKLNASCLPAQVDRVRESLAAEVDSVRLTALADVCEEPVSSAVRVCFRAGGEVDCVLFPGQFVSVNLSNLAPATTAGDLRALAARVGEVRDASVTFCAAAADTAYGRLLFATPAAAAAALARLNHEMVRGREIVLRPGGAYIPKATKAAQQCKVTVSWSLAPSTGRCVVHFLTLPDSQRAARLFGMRGLKVEPFVPKGKPKGGGGAAAAAAVADPTLVLISGLPTTADEDDVRLLVTSCGCKRPKSVSVQRKLQEEGNKPGGGGGGPPAAAAAADARPVSVIVQEIMSLIPLRHRMVSATSFFTEKKAGLTVDYGLDQDLGEVQRLWNEREKQRAQEPAAAAATKFRPYGQKIRLRVEHSMHACIDEGLYTHFRGRLEGHAAFASCDYDVETRVRMDGRGKARVEWHAPSRDALGVAVRLFESVVASTMYNPPSGGRHLLFAKAGRMRMEKATADDVYVLWDARRKVVTIHGELAARQRAVLALNAAVAELQKDYVVERMWLHPAALKVLRQDRNDIVHKYGLLDLKWEGTQLSLTGQPAELAKFRLDGRFAGKIRDTPPAHKGRAAECECPVCFCPVDDERYSLLACGHTYCEACIRGQLAGAEAQTEVQLPLVCVEPACQAKHAWEDMTALASPAALAFIKETAVTKYLLAHGGSVRRCVNTAAGCTSLMDLSQVRVPAGPQEEKAFGGRVAECESCERKYCIACSDRDQQPIEAHAGVPCSMAGLADRVDVRTHVHRIGDLLNLKCPRCACVFVDYSGCAAVTCSNGACNAAFCAMCMRDCGGDAHGHVRQCPLNPSPGNYFVEPDKFQAMHTARRKQEVQKYLAEIADAGLRQLVVVDAARILSDVGIFL